MKTSWTQTSVWARWTLTPGPARPGLGSPPSLVGLVDCFEHDLFGRSLNAAGCSITLGRHLLGHS